MAETTPRGIKYPTAEDKIKDGTSPSALAEDFKDVAVTTDAKIGAAVQEAINDATTKYGGLPARVSSAENRLEGVEAMAGLSPSSPVDGQTANLIQQPDTLTNAALSAAIVQSVTPEGVAYPSIIPSSTLKLSLQPPISSGFRGFSVLPVPKIKRTMQGTFTVDTETLVDALRPPTGVTYYTSPSASSYLNTINDGLTPESPLTLLAIMDKPDVGTVIYAEGEYDRGIVSLARPIQRSVNHIGIGDVRLTGWNKITDLTWSSDGGSVYKSTRTGTTNIIDVTRTTSWGDYLMYEKVADRASITKAGQWSTDGTSIYVWALGDTDLSVPENRAQIRVQVTATFGVVGAPGTVQYAENLSIYGASVSGGVLAGIDSMIVAKNCKAKYAQADGFAVKSGHSIAIDCEVSSSGTDGFNYHDTYGSGSEFIEIGCKSHHNGLGSTTFTNNATTSHEAVTGIRVNGEYDHSAGPVVADVNSAHTWNVGCYAGDQAIAVHPYQNASWRLDSTGYDTNPAQMWLDECSSDGSMNAYHVTGTGSEIRIHASGWGNPTYAYSGSSISHYAR